MRFLVAAFLPMVAVAVEVKEGVDWRACRQDAHCVVIEGTCDKTAVNVVFEGPATAYYKELAKRAKCVEKFWTPKGDVIAQCKPTATAEGQEPMGNCTVVAKPLPKKAKTK